MTEFHTVPHKGDPVTIPGLYLTRAAARGIRVPLWVPHRLIAEFVDCAKESGADLAIAHVRKMMKDLGYD